ncbi:hypothetical protein KR084_006240, partial [Drosophila pseudotakahashii]
KRTMKPVLLFCLILTTALFLGRGQANPVEVDIPSPDANELDSDLDSEEETSDKQLRIVSIKVRPRTHSPGHSIYRSDPRTLTSTSCGLEKSSPLSYFHCRIVTKMRSLSNLLARGEVGLWTHSICLQI